MSFPHACIAWDETWVTLRRLVEHGQRDQQHEVHDNIVLQNALREEHKDRRQIKLNFEPHNNAKCTRVCVWDDRKVDPVRAVHQSVTRLAVRLTMMVTLT